MQAPEILERIRNGEDSTTQFKQDVTDANRLAEEMVAFSNAQGGLLLIGVSDDDSVSSLDDTQSKYLPAKPGL
ncbi:MAG: ATP-binding protein [Gammaproteobacteria bacterium]|nr:ATP-binding protein [Gammaproteobacteria bacterium]MBU1723128.1 ATP-binding protein [Gammaproteobacteria bacterium]MBU2007429.1 ATP-binding protein [Gammaproteobacteria bacterium]